MLCNVIRRAHLAVEWSVVREVVSVVIMPNLTDYHIEPHRPTCLLLKIISHYQTGMHGAQMLGHGAGWGKKKRVNTRGTLRVSTLPHENAPVLVVDW